jgi:hypothetical protein
MSLDEKTWEEIIEIGKEACPLRAVLKPGKACPNFGPSGVCEDCTHNWRTTVSLMMKHAGFKRADVEKEREKVRRMKERIKELERKVDPLLGLIKTVARGARAVGEIGTLVVDTFVEELTRKGDGDGHGSDKDTGSKEGGQD